MTGRNSQANSFEHGHATAADFQIDISFPFPLFPFHSLPFSSFPVLSRPFPSFPFLSLSFPSCPFRSLPFPSFPFLSFFPFLSLPFPSFPSFPFLSLPVPSVPFLSLPFPFSLFFPFSLSFPSFPFLSLPFLSCPFCSLPFPSFPFLAPTPSAHNSSKQLAPHAVITTKREPKHRRCFWDKCRVCVQFCLGIQYTWKAPAQRLRKVSAQDLDCLRCSPCRMSHVYALVTKHSIFFAFRN